MQSGQCKCENKNVLLWICQSGYGKIRIYPYAQNLEENSMQKKWKPYSGTERNSHHFFLTFASEELDTVLLEKS